MCFLSLIIYSKICLSHILLLGGLLLEPLTNETKINTNDQLKIM